MPSAGSRVFRSCVALDHLREAHLYTGALAAEITLLLRRVKDRCGVADEAVTHIASSATLGGTTEDLRDFAAKLFSLPGAYIEVVEGSKAGLPDSRVFSGAPAPSASELARYADLEIITLVDDPEKEKQEFCRPDSVATERVKEALAGLLSSGSLASAERTADGVLAPFLKLALEQAPVVRRLMELVHGTDVLSLRDLAAGLWGSAERESRAATVLLLRMAASSVM